ncbi:MAG: glycosyltransferase family 2 protein [Parabacteroides sp.]
MNRVALSVIIPVYNAEAYLEECLESLRQQSFTDFEVWMIDDGSRDQSGRICDRFAEKDPRFQVVHKANGGVSSARNIGLERARGAWICFVDSDDTVGSTYLEGLIHAAGSRKDQLVVQGYRTICPNGPLFRLFEDHLYEAAEVYRTFEELHINRCGFPFGKLYNHDIIRQANLRFNEQIHYAEDVMFMLAYLCHVSAIRTLPGTQYNYFVRNNASLSQRIFTFESEHACYRTYRTLMEQLRQRFQLSEAALKNPYNVISEYLIRRAVGSLYQSSTKKPLSQRLSILRSTTPEETRFLQQYYRDCNWFHKVTVYLLSKHYYYLCDLLNQGIVTGRAWKQRIIKR